MCRKTVPIFLAFVLMAGHVLAGSGPEGQQKPLVFTHITVIDTTGAAAQPGMTVVISGDRIKAVGKTGNVDLPDGADVLDMSGKFLIPGLWDMHVHWYDRRYLPLFVANGVTGVRQMAGSPVHLVWRKESSDRSLAEPRMVVAGRIVDGPKPMWPGSIAAGTAEEGRRAVQITKSEGYDFVKVYSRLPREAYFAIAAEAKELGLALAGHTPGSVSVAEASDAGQRSIEHLTGILLGCSSREEEIRHEMLTHQEAGAPDPALFHQGNQKCLDTYDEKKAAELFSRFVRNGTWQVPTLTTARALANLDDANLKNDPRLKYMPLPLRERWNPANDLRFKNLTAENFASQRAVFRKRLEIVGSMHRSGVGILAGTDVLNPYCFPGFSLHDELELLVEAGLTPAEALQTATRNPAQYLQQERDQGTVEAGKIADLVLLDADPMLDIRNTRKIAGVVVGGKFLNEKALEKMLAEVEMFDNKK